MENVSCHMPPNQHYNRTVLRDSCYHQFGEVLKHFSLREEDFEKLPNRKEVDSWSEKKLGWLLEDLLYINLAVCLNHAKGFRDKNKNFKS